MKNHVEIIKYLDIIKKNTEDIEDFKKWKKITLSIRKIKWTLQREETRLLKLEKVYNHSIKGE